MNIKMKQIRKRFFSLRGEVDALKDISAEVRDGEFFVLLGPSGCGKSTLLNIIAGLEKPSSGEVLFDDAVVASPEKNLFLSSRKRNVAFVFQNYALYPHLSVYENIAFPLRISRAKEDSICQAVEKTADMLGISELLHSRPGELSGGQKQRVAIARAIVRRPNVFLLDEPLSNLDAQLRISMRAELKNLQKDLGVTTLYVTHDQQEAMSLGDRIAVLRNGKIEQIGSPEELYGRPANAFVARFVGSPPMNLIHASVHEEKNELFLIMEKEKIKISEERKDLIYSYGEKEIFLGIRPEDIVLDAGGAGQMIQGKILVIEQLGRERLVHIQMGESRLTAFSHQTDLKPGQRINIALDMDKLHFFNKK